MHLANVCTIMARDRGIVQVIYHMTRHMTIWVIECTCVLLLVRDKRRAWKALELITDTHCIIIIIIIIIIFKTVIYSHDSY